MLFWYWISTSPVVAEDMMEQSTIPPMPILNDNEWNQVYQIVNVVNMKANWSYQQNNMYYKRMIKALERLSKTHKKYRTIIRGVVYRLHEQISYSGYQWIDVGNIDPELLRITEQLINTFASDVSLDSVKDHITNILQQSNDKKSYAQLFYASINALVIQYQKINNTNMVEILRSVQWWLMETYISKNSVISQPNIYQTLNNVYSYGVDQSSSPIVFGQTISMGDLSVVFNKEEVLLDSIGVDVLTESVMRKNSSTSLLSVLQNKSIPHKIVRISATVFNPVKAPIGLNISNLVCIDSLEQFHTAQNRLLDPMLFAAKTSFNYSSYVLLNPSESLVSCSAVINTIDKNGNNIYVQY